MLVVLLRGVSSNSAEAAPSDWLIQLAQVIVGHHRVMVLTVLIRATHHLVPFQFRVRPVLHLFRALPCQVLLPVIPVLGVPFSFRG